MKNNEAIPFLDLVTPHRALMHEFQPIIEEVLNNARFIGGPLLENFETAFAQFCSARYCVGVANGTDALRFAFIAAGIEQGEIVLTVPHTFIATTEAISQVGGRIMFIDIDEKTYTMDPAALARFFSQECSKNSAGNTIHTKSGKRVSAIVPVHLYGQAADMDPIMELADQYNCKVIEDACQAHGAQYFSNKQQCWKKAGSMGVAAAFSFYPGKNLGACGEAGAVTTNDEAIAATVKMLRDHGQKKKYIHDIEGFNGRLDALQAGFLGIKLKYLHEWNKKRREHAEYYKGLFKGDRAVIAPFEPSWSKSVYHLYVIVLKDTQTRDELQKWLTEQNIGTGLHYPIPLHLQKAYKHLGLGSGDFPVSERVAQCGLSLPMFPELTPQQQDVVVNAIHEFFKNRG